MKSFSKSLIFMFLVLVLVVTALPPLQAKAAKKGRVQNIEMYIGEAYEYTNFSRVKSVKNTNKNAISAYKSKDRDNYVVFEAKKPGKSKITAVTKYGTFVVNVTVKKSKFEYKVYNINKGEILVEVMNKTKAIFQDGKFKYSLKGADGTEYLSDEISVYSLIPNKKSYAKIVFNASAFEPDVTKTSINMVSISRSPAYKYTNVEKKLKLKDSIKAQTEAQVTVSINTKNTGKVPVKGNVYIVFYNVQGEPIDFVSHGVYLQADKTETSDANCYLRMTNFDTKERVAFGHYEIVKNVYTSEYVK